MKLSRFFSFLVIPLLICPMGFPNINRDTNMTPVKALYVPKGNAEAGREAFQILKCGACHWVANDSKLPQGPVSYALGPVMGGKQAHYTRGWLATEIIAPSHTIVSNVKGVSENSELSRMGDFSEIMTVRQLIDIVAYIRSLKALVKE